MLVAIGFAVFLSGLAVAVSARGVGCPPLLCGAAVAVGAVAGVFGSGRAETVSVCGVDVSDNGVSGAIVAVGAAAGVFVSGLADTVSARGVDISGNGVPCAVVGVLATTAVDCVSVAPAVWPGSPDTLGSAVGAHAMIRTIATMAATTNATVSMPPITVDTAAFNNCATELTRAAASAIAIETALAAM